MSGQFCACELLCAYWYMGSTARERLGTEFLASAQSEQTPSFFTLNSEASFLQFKEQGPFKITGKNNGDIIPLSTPPPLFWVSKPLKWEMEVL